MFAPLGHRSHFRSSDGTTGPLAQPRPPLWTLFFGGLGLGYGTVGWLWAVHCPSFCIAGHHSEQFLKWRGLELRMVDHARHLPDGACYTDGSYFPADGACGACVVLPHQQVLITSTPSHREDCFPCDSAERAELLGVLIACASVEPHSTIYTDCRHLVDVFNYHFLAKKLRRHNREVIRDIQQLLAQRSLSLRYVRGHSGNQGNEMADTGARRAARLMT